LRASLDGRKQNIKVVFAGSSEATLRRMFGRSTEPFYNWAPLEPFDLGDRERLVLLPGNHHAFFDSVIASAQAVAIPPEAERKAELVDD
jgi:hypothetical protein